ncbi:MAG: radical SAM protein [Chloroflexota bacterium]
MPLDVLLVNPLFLSHDPVEQRLMTPYFPLGLLYLGATLREAGFTVEVFDGAFQAGPDAIEVVLADRRPRLVGISILSTVRHTALELARRAHAAGAIVVVGGSDPTARAADYIALEVEGQPIVDYAVIGEGEETLLQLVTSLLRAPGRPPVSSILGLAYRAIDGSAVFTPTRPLRQDVDALPLPARDLVDLEAYRRAWRAAHGFFSMSLIAGRGCPYTCAWCQKSVFGRSYRARSPEGVAAEMRHIKATYHPDRLRIVDDVLGIDKRWVRRWREAVLAQDAVIPYESLSRVDLVDRELLALLKDTGCVRIAFGAESGSQRVLDAMTKGTKVEQIRAAARLCHELGIEIYFYIMLGYPGEEWPDIQATVRLLRETVPDEFSSTIAYPLPGTPFFEQVRDRLTAAPDWDYTAENRLVYRGRYSTRFYRWVQRWLHAEWQTARARSGHAPASLARRVRILATVWVTRLVVQSLRLLPADLRPVPTTAPGNG